ncbi:metapyrocatechase [Achromobacter sp. HZ01]|jgi:catechol 2,3-dioxygenase-like lactoylglutathione lyase family enzyme|uniref:Metapyrocatechase n=1 Tax=Achromobacter pulmonis TaxID=1389932 RepID=A0A2N8KH05_9BURK|nr:MULTISPECIES: VOC family protein [Achromobacter]ACV31216.1 2,3-dihydroxybiphenyl dioxygenase [uncultured bacterium]PND32737.1 metapyrocatechase [Achromobacter pulmonis]RAP62962.1 metapyrocatechase [Achromobacter sp. HZ01]
MSFNKPDSARYGVHSIDHFALQVPDLEQAERFLRAFGLEVAHAGGALELRCAGDDHCWSRIVGGGPKQLAYLSLNCYEDEFDAIREQALAAGARPAAPGAHGESGGFWFLDPDGNLLQLKPGPKTSPDTKSRNASVQVAPGQRGSAGRGKRPRARPARLSHVLMFTTDMERSLRFYSDALGLYLSDRSRDIVAFMHARHGSDHHLVAFVKDAARGWHHSAWDVPGLEDVGCGAEQMRDAGYKEGWGVARHTLGSNYFYYVRDPWGSFWEYSAHIDYVPAGFDWPAGDYPPEDALYMWGPEMPAYFVQNTERQ